MFFPWSDTNLLTTKCFKMRRFYGDIVTGASGSLNRKHGGMTSLKNGVVRVRVVPKYSRTEKQDVLRAEMAILAQGWASLSVDSQKGWNAAVSDPLSMVHDPITGTSRPPASGRNLFILRNLNIQTGTEFSQEPSIWMTAYSNEEFPRITVGYPVFTPGQNPTFTIEITGDIGASAVSVRVSPPLGKGITKAGVAQGKTVGVGNIEDGDVVQDMQSLIELHLGEKVAAGERRYVETYHVNSKGQKVFIYGVFVNT